MENVLGLILLNASSVVIASDLQYKNVIHVLQYEVDTEVTRTSKYCHIHQLIIR